MFYLKDGTRIRSEADRHETTEGGYLVRGERWKAGKRLGSFSNVLQDYEIQKIAVYEFDSSRTGIAVGVTVGTLAILISYLWWGPGAPYM